MEYGDLIHDIEDDKPSFREKVMFGGCGLIVVFFISIILIASCCTFTRSARSAEPVGAYHLADPITK